MAFTTSSQETEWAYSYSPGAHTGWPMSKPCLSAMELTSNHRVTTCLTATDLEVLTIISYYFHFLIPVLSSQGMKKIMQCHEKLLLS